MASNKFFYGVLRIAQEKGHTVCASGPYQYVRHPGYLGAILFDLATPLILNSAWAFVPAILTVCAIVVRTINFKKLGRLVPEGSSRHHKLAAFSARDDVVTAILKREKMDSLDRITAGTAVKLDRLIMKPGGGFPLVNFNLVLGAVTCAGKLSLVIEFVEDNVAVEAMEELRDRALAFLLEK